MPPSERFDAAYYRRFYGRDGVHDRRQIGTLATAITGWTQWWQLPVHTVLDVGAGKGYWRDWFATEHPRVSYSSIDASPYACRTYGHELADVSAWHPPRAHDLVICQSVLQYLDDRKAQDAIGVLATACAGLLYLEVPTTADRAEVIDVDRTDMDVHWRTGAWYRRRLDPHFIQIGGGLWASRTADAPFFELEISPRSRPRTAPDRDTPPGA